MKRYQIPAAPLVWSAFQCIGLFTDSWIDWRLMATSGTKRELVEGRLSALTSDFGRYVDAHDQHVGFAPQQLRLHRQTIALRRQANGVGEAVDSADFLISLRSTLKAWRLGVRRSRLTPQREFDQAILSAREQIEVLDGLFIDDPALPVDVGERVWRVIETLEVVDNRAKLVAGTKTLHHLLPDRVVPMDHWWTGRFFQLGSHEWQQPPYQRCAFLQAHRDFCELGCNVEPQQYVDGRGWRTSRTKVLDNALIGFCMVELPGERGDQTNDLGRELWFRVPGLPPAKNEALSMLGAGHSHAPRVLELLRAARDALQRSGFVPFDGGPVTLDVVVHAPAGQDPWDATNYLGGIADVLEEKSRRGTLEHLGELRQVWVYRNDRQIKEIAYRQLEAPDAFYTVRIRELSSPAAEERGLR